MFSTTAKIGVLGAGQLGKMLCLAAANLDLKLCLLDRSRDYPGASVCFEFTEGNFNNYDDVLHFGRDKDILTVEIEHVDTRALHELEAMGKIVHPSPKALDIIKDKGLQKLFYAENDIPTAPFRLFDDEKALKSAVDSGELAFPFVQKTRTAGYDGRGVSVIRRREEFEEKCLSGPCLAEELIPFASEIAVIAARNERDEVVVYPPVEMDFHPEANLVEFLICPAGIGALASAQAESLAEKVIRALDICGLLAVEMFLTADGRLLVNESAPRPHNSGHHTIESAVTSQFQQHLRAICGLPLGATRAVRPAVMLNLLGEPGFSGPVRYEGMEDCLGMEEVYIHLYGKSETRPFRKMGHATVTGETAKEALEKAGAVKERLKVVSF